MTTADRFIATSPPASRTPPQVDTAMPEISETVHEPRVDIDAIAKPHDEEEQATAKSANDDPKPAEVPDSDESTTNNDEPSREAPDKEEPLATNEDVVEEDENIVEGDEDTVIY